MNKFLIVPLMFSMVLPTWEASAACQNQGGLVCGGGAPSLSSPGGLQVSRGGQFRPLDSGALLRGGDRILSGANAATLSLGASCSVAVGAGSLVSLSRSGGQTCARVKSVDSPTAAQQSASNAPGAPNGSSAPNGPGAPNAPGAAGASGAAGTAGAAGVAGLSTPALAGLIAAGTAGAVGIGVSASSSNRSRPQTVSAQ